MVIKFHTWVTKLWVWCAVLFNSKEMNYVIDLNHLWEINVFSVGFYKTLDPKFFVMILIMCMFVFLSLVTHREPDIPAWAPLLYQLQLLDIREKPDLLTLPIADRIRIGNQKRERGNFHFQREEYCLAARAYCMALDMLTTRCKGTTCIKGWIYS